MWAAKPRPFPCAGLARPRERGAPHWRELRQCTGRSAAHRTGRCAAHDTGKRACWREGDRTTDPPLLIEPPPTVEPPPAAEPSVHDGAPPPALLPPPPRFDPLPLPLPLRGSVYSLSSVAEPLMQHLNMPPPPPRDFGLAPEDCCGDMRPGALARTVPSATAPWLEASLAVVTPPGRLTVAGRAGAESASAEMAPVSGSRRRNVGAVLPRCKARRAAVSAHAFTSKNLLAGKRERPETVRADCVE